MCGLVGIVGDLDFKDEALMRRLLVFDYFRGPDSTGFAALRKDGEAKIAKIASNPLNLFDLKRYQDAQNAFQSLAFLGHNRYSTRGKTNDVNAHPFAYGNVVGAHNGTLEKSSWKDLEAMIGEETDVDSQAIIKCIAENGIENTVPLLRGAWALTWFDTKKRTMNFIRNDERTLWWGMNKDLDKFFYASEYKIMDLAIHNVSTQSDVQELYQNENGSHFFSFIENWWYEIPLDDLKKGYKELPNFKKMKLEGAGGTVVSTAPFRQQNAGATVTPRGGQNSHSTSKTTTNSTTTSHTSTKSSLLNRELVGSKKNPFGDQKYVDGVDFHTLAVNGCGWCKSTIDFEEPGLTLYTERDLVICPSCGTNHDKQTKVYVKEL